MLLAGIGNVGQNQKKNFLVVDSSTYTSPLLLPAMRLNGIFVPAETHVPAIEAAFEEFTQRKDIAILLINQHVCIHYRMYGGVY